eukprot:9749614-Alexandrium_andersonii.AAC.1
MKVHGVLLKRMRFHGFCSDLRYTMPDGTVVSGVDAMSAWGVPVDSDVFLVSLPLPLARVCVHGAWGSVMVLGRWRCRVRLFPRWLPEAFFKTVANLPA